MQLNKLEIDTCKWTYIDMIEYLQFTWLINESTNILKLFKMLLYIMKGFYKSGIQR